MADDQDRMQELKEREGRARERLGESARSLKDVIATEAQRLNRDHPWALPAIGFCAGLLAPFIVPARRGAPPRAAERSASHLRGAWDEARAAAADSLTEAVGAIIRRVLSSPSRDRWSEDDNGCSR